MVGIDPGSTTGVAVVQKGKVLYCKQFRKQDAMHAIRQVVMAYSQKTAAVELPKLGVMYQKHVFKKAGQGQYQAFSGGQITVDDYRRLEAQAGQRMLLTPGQVRLCQNVGQNIAWSHEIAGQLRGMGLRVKMVHPRPKRTKWKPDYWCNAMEWQAARVPGEHARDAACIAFFNEGGSA